MIKRFRLNCKKVALTYPQCPEEWTKESVLMWYEEQMGLNLEEYIIARERHEDGNPHFHVYLRVADKIDTKNCKYFDIDGHHGNYKGIGTGVTQWMRYCRKDGDFIEKLIADGRTKEERNKSLLEYALRNGLPKALEEGLIPLKDYVWYNNSLELYKSQITLPDAKEDLPNRLENPWLNDFILDLDQKQCHLWIWSQLPNLGKTTWMLSLMRKYRATNWNYLESFQNHIDLNTEMIVMDEYRGQLKISILNAICDGTFQIPRKHQKSFLLSTKPLVIILGNRSMEACYKEEHLIYLRARFRQFEITEFKN